MENSNSEEVKPFVNWFRNTSPYINAHRDRTFVIGFGGEAVSHPNFHNVIHDIALLNSLGIRLVLVHGAREQINERLALRNITPKFHCGLRVTDEDTLTCVQDAAGTVRIQIEALLSMGVANSPMHGAQIRASSGNFVVAQPIGIIDGVDYCHTGKVRKIETEAIAKQLDDRAVIVLSHLGYSPTGEVFNLPAEEVAKEVAIALNADKLIFLTEQEGLMGSDGQLVREYIPKDNRPSDTAAGNKTSINSHLNAAISALKGGVTRCHLIGFQQDGALLQELFTRDGQGTLLSSDSYETVRTATIDDAGGLIELLEPLEKQGVLVRRSREMLETEIEQFTVIDRDGMIVGCAALYPFIDQQLGELACVAVHPDYRE
ncbi:MAG: amino-acid N-acetyltransferase, partial [Pseudomonadales bacterium]|nr:amino-acid N-acetyltransferase [Pseudomonadales bacterium]